jgi:hypothetical protein
MKRITALIIGLFLFVSVVASAETSIDTIRSWIDLGIGEGEIITDVSLDDRILSVYIDLLGTDEKYPGWYADLADIRTSSITDELLNHKEFDDEWDILFFNYKGVGAGVYSKLDIRVNEYDMRYIEVYNDDGSTKMDLIQ